MKSILNEAMPALVPEYPVEVAGHHLKLRFDVNINKTKKGVKMQFVMGEVPTNQQELQDITAEIATSLQDKFGSSGLQIIQDLENPYRNVVGFLIPLPSIADYVIKHALKHDTSLEQKPEEPQEEPEQQLPDREMSAGKETPREPMMEWMMKMAGLK